MAAAPAGAGRRRCDELRRVLQRRRRRRGHRRRRRRRRRRVGHRRRFGRRRGVGVGPALVQGRHGQFHQIQQTCNASNVTMTSLLANQRSGNAQQKKNLRHAGVSVAPPATKASLKPREPRAQEPQDREPQEPQLQEQVQEAKERSAPEPRPRPSSTA